MAVGANSGAVRELLVVLALAVAGLLLAMLAAFTPWYGDAVSSGGAEVVELRVPAGGPGGEVMATGS
jgi:hypothetical protein